MSEAFLERENLNIRREVKIAALISVLQRLTTLAENSGNTVVKGERADDAADFPDDGKN